MSAAMWQAAGLTLLGAMLAAALPARGGVGVAAGGLGALAAAGWLAASREAWSPVAGCGAALALGAGLIGQLRLFTMRTHAVAGGWRGRASAAGAPLFGALALAGAAMTDDARPALAARLAVPVASSAAGLLLTGLAMVGWRGRGAVARGPGDALRGRRVGVRLALIAALAAAFGGFGVLMLAAGVASPAALPAAAAVLLVAGAAAGSGLPPLQGLALGWLETAPPWLGGGIAVAVAWPVLLELVTLRAGIAGGPPVAVLAICGACGVAAAGLLAATRRAGPREAAWLALTGLAACGVAAGTPAGLSGAVLAGIAQVLVASLPAGLGRGEALAMLAGCFMPAVLVGAAAWWTLPPLLAGVAGLGIGALSADAAREAPGDPWRWMVLVLLLGIGLAMPAPVGELVAAVAASGMPA